MAENCIKNWNPIMKTVVNDKMCIISSFFMNSQRDVQSQVISTALCNQEAELLWGTYWDYITYINMCFKVLLKFVLWNI